MAYTDKPYREWLDKAEALLRQIELPEEWDASLPVELEAAFVVAKPKTSKLYYPKPDIDNYDKSLMDAITQAGHIWQDDSQVIASKTCKVFADDVDIREGIHIRITQVELGDL